MENLFLQVRGITPGRAAIMLPALMGLISIILGWLAIRRSKTRINTGKMMAIIALMLALIDIIMSAQHLARATGDIGTGSGKLGAIVALVFGLTGIVLGTLVLVRVRRMA